MADPLVPSTQESKLSALNKKIIEIKKKIQLSEGQRKANFEECDAKKKECCDQIANLKKDIKNLRIKLAKSKNNEDAAERILQTSRDSSACIRKRGLEAAIDKIDEDNIRLRKKLDLVKYRSDKQQNKLAVLLEEYEELVNGKTMKIAQKKLEHPLKKVLQNRKIARDELNPKIVDLENQLQRINVMQMEADTVRKKYKSVRSSLKSDAATYVSSLRSLEENIKEQETEIKQLQEVKEEAIELRDATKETLTKQEIDAMNTTKARDFVILDYRQRVEDRKLELERLERMIFPATRQLPRDDFESNDEILAAKDNDKRSDNTIPKDEVGRLEEAFVKLRGATGVTRTEDVLDRFLSQRATKEKLQRMRTLTENEKISLERKRQQLTAEIESQKFSETKDADENAEQLEELNNRISLELQRQAKAESQNRRMKETLKEISQRLWKFSDLLRDVSDSAVPVTFENDADPLELLEILEEKMKSCIELLGGQEKYVELMDQKMVDRFDDSSINSKSDNGKNVNVDERPLFPNFPGVVTPAAATQASEDEDEVPTRSVLKRQAQLLVDTKSRRKGFNFRR